ncbi:hypothetical protein PQR66_23855 [Paraburkholderia agricolaris]|uniref:Uncharacterized protein n=1 Tax=Paraburkholderia agricolaris TaxID=2152888 RepID=A0ABW8ZTZ8_9BURK
MMTLLEKLKKVLGTAPLPREVEGSHAFRAGRRAFAKDDFNPYQAGT